MDPRHPLRVLVVDDTRDAADTLALLDIGLQGGMDGSKPLVKHSLDSARVTSQ